MPITVPSLRLLPAALVLAGWLAGCGGSGGGADAPLPPVDPLPPAVVHAGTIAFVCEYEDGDNDEICLMDADGQRVRRLTDNAGPDRAPNWSPDGRQLVFNSRRAPHADRPQIYRHDVATGQAVRVTEGDLEDQRASWEPGGEAIVFQRGTFAAGYGLYRQAIAGAAPALLVGEAGKVEAAGDYAPDGTRLVFQSNRDAAGLFPFSTYVLTLSTGAVTRVAAGVDASHDGPRWSPDGTRIVFSAGGDLYLLTVASGEVEAVTDDDHGDSSPAWSPDGTFLVFQSDRMDEDRTSLHILDLETRAISNLGFGRTPVWTAREFGREAE